jgi:hypothetical protein
MNENSEPTPNTSPGSNRFAPLYWFLGIMLALAALRIGVGLASIPRESVPLASAIVSILFVAGPVAAIFKAASFRWTWKNAIAMIAVGAVAHVAGSFLAESAGNRLAAGAFFSLGQIGLVSWCLGIGALLNSALRDKNILVPMAVFLALFDFWLVFVPEGPVGQMARGSQAALVKVAYQVPEAATASAGGKAQAMAYVGPADFLFLAMFFVALFKFNLRTRETARAMVPTLALYLMAVLFFNTVKIGPFALGALPALIPIGAVVLAVNWREFRLRKDELLSTAMILVIGIPLIAWRMSIQHPQPDTPAATSQSGDVLVVPEPEHSHAPGDGHQH